MYPSTPRTPRILTQKSKMLGFLVLWLVVSIPLHAGPSKTCEDALTLPLTHSVAGYATAKTPQRYVIEVERSGLLAIEARGTAPDPLTVRFLGRDCTDTVSNLPIATIHGRHLHRVKGPDKYFVEIAAGNLARNYEIDAWWVEDSSDLPTKEEMAESDEIGGLPNKEEMAESDEFGGLPNKEEMAESDEFGGLPNKEEMAESDEFGGLPNKEEMAESDEFGGLPNKEEMAESDEFDGSLPAWQEIAGHGLLEIGRAPGGLVETRFHSLCPWTRRPGLLATFTCAPRLRLNTSNMVTVEPLASAGSQLIGVTLASSGRLAIEAVDDPSGSTVAFDAEGRFIGDMSGNVAWFEAGDYFFETSAGSSPIRIYAEID